MRNWYSRSSSKDVVVGSAVDAGRQPSLPIALSVGRRLDCERDCHIDKAGWLGPNVRTRTRHAASARPPSTGRLFLSPTEDRERTNEREDFGRWAKREGGRERAS